MLTRIGQIKKTQLNSISGFADTKKSHKNLISFASKVRFLMGKIEFNLMIFVLRNIEVNILLHAASGLHIIIIAPLCLIAPFQFKASAIIGRSKRCFCVFRAAQLHFMDQRDHRALVGVTAESDNLGSCITFAFENCTARPDNK